MDSFESVTVSGDLSIIIIMLYICAQITAKLLFVKGQHNN